MSRKKSESRLLLCIAALFATSIASAQLSNVLSSVIHVEEQLSARVGVALYDLETNEHILYHGEDLFPLSSTFKPLACAALLRQVDLGLDSMQRRVIFEQDTLVSYSPITETRVGSNGMTLAELCEATITVSDNTAGNLILEAIGGPQGLTQFLKSIGDSTTRLDRWETELNESLPGDVRDTTSPDAMASTMQSLLFGNVLSPSSKDQLDTWLRADTVGDALLRAGIPKHWSIGDKTGAGGFGSRSIVAVMWPPDRKPIIAAIYMTETDASFDERNGAIASIGKAIGLSVDR